MVHFGGHKKHISFSFFALLFSLLLIITGPCQVFSLSHFNHIVFKENNVLFWNPDEGCETSVEIIGDSITDQAKTALREKLPDAEINFQWGRPWEDGLEIISGGVTSGILVWLLGTNNFEDPAQDRHGRGDPLTEANITALYESVGPNTQVILMSLYDGYGDNNSIRYAGDNELIRGAVEKYENFHLFDWASIASPEFTRLDNDNEKENPENGYGLFQVHLTDPAGIEAFSSGVASAVEEQKTDIESFCYSRYSRGSSCSNSSAFQDNSGDYWDGHCSGVGAYDAWINKHINTIRNIASKNGLPWEAILAQSILESSGGSKDVCSYNPLGLKAKKGWSSCDGSHASFSNYDEAFQYYVDSILPVREAKNKYTNDPYGYIEFIQHGATYHYAESNTYTNSVSGIVCGIQKWAESHGYSTSSKTPSAGPSNSSGSIVNCYSGDFTISEEGGMTEDQAKRFVINYGANKDGLPASSIGSGLWNTCGGPGGSNCVSFAAFFLNAFTSTPFNHGNGWQVARNLNAPTGSTPAVFSIISSGQYGDEGYGHVAVVLGIQDGKYIIGHASCSRGKNGKRGAGNGTQGGSGSAFIKVETSPDPSKWWGMNGTTPIFAYPSGVDTSKIANFAS